MFTTEPSRRAMLDPTMAATSVSHFRLCDRAASKAGVASMIPASQGGRVNPIIGCSRKTDHRRFSARASSSLPRNVSLIGHLPTFATLAHMSALLQIMDNTHLVTCLDGQQN